MAAKALQKLLYHREREREKYSVLSLVIGNVIFLLFPKVYKSVGFKNARRMTKSCLSYGKISKFKY